MESLQVFWDTLQPLIITGITVGVVLAVIVGSIKFGWRYEPWIVLLGLVILFLN